jgi:hypothetical protein
MRLYNGSFQDNNEPSSHVTGRCKPARRYRKLARSRCNPEKARPGLQGSVVALERLVASWNGSSQGYVRSLQPWNRTFQAYDGPSNLQISRRKIEMRQKGGACGRTLPEEDYSAEWVVRVEPEPAGLGEGFGAGVGVGSGDPSDGVALAFRPRKGWMPNWISFSLWIP